MVVNIIKFVCRGKQWVKQIHKVKESKTNQKFSTAWKNYIRMFLSHTMQLDSHSCWLTKVRKMEGFFILLKSRNTNMNVVFSASFEFPLPSSEWIILWSTPAVWSNCLNTGRRILRFYQCQWIATVSGSLCCLTEPGSAKSSTKKRSPKPINNIFTGKRLIDS